MTEQFRDENDISDRQTKPISATLYNKLLKFHVSINSNVSSIDCQAHLAEIISITYKVSNDMK